MSQGAAISRHARHPVGNSGAAAAVHQQVLPGEVPGVDTAKECVYRSELPGIA
jgi:hypothetical protein